MAILRGKPLSFKPPFSDPYPVGSRISRVVRRKSMNDVVTRSNCIKSQARDSVSDKAMSKIGAGTCFPVPLLLYCTLLFHKNGFRDPENGLCCAGRVVIYGVDASLGPGVIPALTFPNGPQLSPSTSSEECCDLTIKQLSRRYDPFPTIAHLPLSFVSFHRLISHCISIVFESGALLFHYHHILD